MDGDLRGDGAVGPVKTVPGLDGVRACCVEGVSEKGVWGEEEERGKGKGEGKGEKEEVEIGGSRILCTRCLIAGLICRFLC